MLEGTREMYGVKNLAIGKKEKREWKAEMWIIKQEKAFGIIQDNKIK